MFRFGFYRLGLLLGIFFLPQILWSQTVTSTVIDSLLELVEQENNAEKKADLLVQVANRYRSIKLDSCEVYANRALTISEAIGYEAGIAKAHTTLGVVEEIRTNFDAAMRQYRLAEAIALNQEDQLLLGNALGAMGRAKMMEWQRDSALYFLNRAADIFSSREQHPNRLAVIYATTGQVYKRSNQYNKALAYYLKAEQVLTEAGMGNRREMGPVLNNLGQIYTLMDRWEEAIVVFKKSLALNESWGMLVSSSIQYNNIGASYTELKSYPEALEYLEKSLAIRRQTGNKDLIAMSLSNIGSVYHDMGQHEKAIEYLQQSLSLLDSLDRPDIQVSTYNILGRTYVSNKDYTSANTIYSKAIPIAEQLKENREKMLLLKDRANLYRLTGDFQRAYQDIKTYEVIKDSLFTLEKVNTIADLQEQYEAAEKEKEISQLREVRLEQDIQLAKNQRNQTIYLLGILVVLTIGLFYFFRYRTKQKANELLAEKNQIIADQNENLKVKQSALAQSLSEKDILLKEIHHRVKNNLQLITSLLNLQAKDTPAQSLEEFLYKGQNRVKSMALIHEQLYRSSNLSFINIADYTADLMESIFQSFGIQNDQIKYHIEAENLQLDIDQAIPVGLIINELVNNSLKHAFKDQESGQVKVLVKQAPEKVLLRVADDGNYEGEAASSNSIGLQLVQLLVKQLKGTFQLDVKEGTIVDIQFKLAS